VSSSDPVCVSSSDVAAAAALSPAAASQTTDSLPAGATHVPVG